uniref:UDP-N-acetylglucosamine--dolichyl-phosphate N-acetylglucosaminephosphotransferase n=1 Tax=Albugo laibachii Nc14 TaxID=890382 RepID=F0WHB7_9STRA|nr:UDPNacetylglucosaminedolichylphosphate Nacetylglucosaminephosphotransferase putative [Albugo laibachii Nc14]|eukprot:CCA20633.1 UDPNacetylglucosaminedolichylphosphate Nacetylglucosaminephosphotransferase putative [Albugo laibachii Nc14]
MTVSWIAPFALLVLVSAISYFAVVLMIPPIALRLSSKLAGKDLCKKGTPSGDIAIPEAIGIVSGGVYVLALLCLALFVVDDVNVQRMTLCGIISITLMIILGILDDFSDLRWRHKLLYPPLATIPLLLYYPGVTSVVIPKPIRFLLQKDSVLPSILTHFFDISDGGEIVELGWLFYVYMAMMAVFCTNAINIYAGVNGLEAGQSCVIALAVLVQNAVQLYRGHDNENFHCLSLIFMLPYLATTLGLLKHNWYPARVFVGDTFCYYAGMTFAVGGILGHYSKTLLLFFMPQVINFLYSIPQLCNIVPCPRHRLPRFNAKTGLLEPSTISPTSSRSNLTVINAFLVCFGPMHERTLVIYLLLFQAFSCAIAFYIRYGLSQYLYDFVH